MVGRRKEERGREEAVVEGDVDEGEAGELVAAIKDSLSLPLSLSLSLPLRIYYTSTTLFYKCYY